MIFKKNNATPSQNIETTQIDSLIGSNLKIVGDLFFSGGLRIDGTVEGNVTGTHNEKSLMVLSKESHINGNVQSYDAVINGEIVGDVTISHFLELQSNAVIKGNISYRQLQMECGVVVDGNLKKIAGSDEEVKALPNHSNVAVNVKNAKNAKKDKNLQEQADSIN